MSIKYRAKNEVLLTGDSSDGIESIVLEVKSMSVAKSRFDNKELSEAICEAEAVETVEAVEATEEVVATETVEAVEETETTETVETTQE